MPLLLTWSGEGGQGFGRAEIREEGKATGKYQELIWQRGSITTEALDAVAT